MQASIMSLGGTTIHQNYGDPDFVVMQESSGFDFPDISRMTPYAKPGKSGSIVPNSFYDGRTINLIGRIKGSTPTAYALNKRAFFSLAAIVENSYNIAQPILLAWTTLDGIAMQVECYAAQTPKYTEVGLTAGKYQFQFYAPDYNIYSQSEQVNQINLSSATGLVFPATAPFVFPASSGGKLDIANNGYSNMYPIITFYGPLTSPYVQNLSLGEQFSVNYTLVSGDILTVDMFNGTMVLNGTQNAMQYFDYLNTWLSLQPAIYGTNTINFGSGLSSDTGYIKIASRDAYLTA